MVDPRVERRVEGSYFLKRERREGAWYKTMIDMAGHILCQAKMVMHIFPNELWRYSR
jgi:hypothetical protein